MNKETPCIAVCMIDPKTSPCFGRGRALAKIPRWHGMDSAEPRAVEARLPTIATEPEREQGIAALSEESNHEAPADLAVLAVLAGLSRRYCSQGSAQGSGADRSEERRVG